MSSIWRFPESWGVPLVSSKSWMTMTKVLKHGDVGIAYDLRSLHIIVDWLVQGIVPGLLGIVIASHNP